MAHQDSWLLLLPCRRPTLGRAVVFHLACLQSALTIASQDQALCLGTWWYRLQLTVPLALAVLPEPFRLLLAP